MKTQTLELFLTAIEALEAKVATLEARVTPGAKVPRAHDILAGVLEETGYRSGWEANTLSAAEHTELLHLVRMEGRRWFRDQAIRTLDEIDNLESKALFGPAKDKISGFFRGARKYVRELFVAGVLAFAGPTPLDAAELRALDAEVAVQEKYLKTFEREIVEENKPLDGTFAARAEQYGASVWGAAQEILRSGVAADHSYSHERRIHQGEDKPCPVCIEEEAKGWQPIGKLRKIGDSPCRCQCHCVLVFGEPGDVAKAFGLHEKRYVPCRDARGRFASCNGAPQGTRHPKPEGHEASKPTGGKKPKKKPGKKKPVAPKKPKEQTPKKPAEKPTKPTEKKPPKEKPAKPEKPAEKPEDTRRPADKLRDDVRAASASPHEERRLIREYLDKHQKPAVEQKHHGMSDPEMMHSVEVGGLTVHYKPRGGTDSPEVLQLRVLLRNDPLPDSLTKHTKNLYLSSQKNSHDEYWAVKHNIPGFVSGATGGQGTIVNYHGTTVPSGTLTHEMAHNMAAARYGTSTPAVGSDYRRAMASGEEPINQYARTNPAEDFAEAVSMHFAYPREFARNHPKRAAVIKRLLEDPNYAG